jgi:hypothetical protein
VISATSAQVLALPTSIAVRRCGLLFAMIPCHSRLPYLAGQPNS